ncbi:MAG: hypothetical protein F4164_08910 [Gemmatimonadales bacterium]|nr:hypothetical protein [Gemmatimonadales bacterium]MYG49468.1 hypothetical protein [Gemmatimonadales bacterium]MYK02020.1 hypothetical protein [Candidatus Palauibacter ramosifaciens]
MERPGGIDDEPERLDETLAWMKAGLLMFDRVFGPMLDEIAAESIRPGAQAFSKVSFVEIDRDDRKAMFISVHRAGN